MKFVTERLPNGEWSAIDDDSYDGPGSPMGRGKTGHEAVVDLMDQIQEREGRWLRAHREPVTSYAVSVTRHDADGGRQVVEYGDYGILRELLDAIEAHPDVQRWLEP